MNLCEEMIVGVDPGSNSNVDNSDITGEMPHTDPGCKESAGIETESMALFVENRPEQPTGQNQHSFEDAAQAVASQSASMAACSSATTLNIDLRSQTSERNCIALTEGKCQEKAPDTTSISDNLCDRGKLPVFTQDLPRQIFYSSQTFGESCTRGCAWSPAGDRLAVAGEDAR
jgi:hypothetical protein